MVSLVPITLINEKQPALSNVHSREVLHLLSMSTYTPEYVRIHYHVLFMGILSDVYQALITHSPCPVHASVPPMAAGALLTEVHHNRNSHNSAEKVSSKVPVPTPHTPFIYTIPLPSSTPTLTRSTGLGVNTLYPINILSDPPLVK